MAPRGREPRLPAPWLRSVRLAEDRGASDDYALRLPWLAEGFTLTFDQPVTILVGENGSGKSTLIEALAELIGFPAQGGGAWSGARVKERAAGAAALARHLRPVWLPKVGQGWFLRAASFSAVAGMTSGDYLNVSHGEGFAKLMMERMQGRGIFLLDEPEAALSPRLQAELLAFLAAIQSEADAQVVMATHSPILMAVPNATLLRLSRHAIEEVALRDTEHFRLYQSFTLHPRAFVQAAIAGELDTLT